MPRQLLLHQPLRRVRVDVDDTNRNNKITTTHTIATANNSNSILFFSKSSWKQKLAEDVQVALSLETCKVDKSDKNESSNEKEEEENFEKNKQKKMKEFLLQSSNSKKILHIYNESKDAAQKLLGLLATVKNCSLKEIYQEFDL